MRFHWLFQFCAWIDQTPLSQWIQAAGWIVPLVQTVHILAVAMVLASATMIALRLAGLIALDETPRRVVARFVPFIWWPLIALAGSGLVLIVGEPGRDAEAAPEELPELALQSRSRAAESLPHGTRNSPACLN